MIDLETDHITKPATQYEQSLKSAAHHRSMAEDWRKQAQESEREAEETFRSETKSFWVKHCLKNAAESDEKAIWWAERAERFK